jgi:hypothetical protein
LKIFSSTATHKGACAPLIALYAIRKSSARTEDLALPKQKKIPIATILSNMWSASLLRTVVSRRENDPL